MDVKCIACGAENEEEAQVCKECGAELKASSVDEQPEAKPTPSKAKPRTPSVPGVFDFS